MITFLQTYGMQLLLKTWQHLYISAFSLALGIIVAVPLGILLTRVKSIANVVMAIASMLQTIPAMALLALMIPFFGIGAIPAIIALFIYSLLPILRNTYLGMEDVNPALIDAAKGMGMTGWQSIIKVEVPMAAPVIMAGIRLSATYVIAWAALASYIGAGGLGDFIFNGLNLYRTDLILGGSIPVIILALIVDWLLGKLEAVVTPKTSHA
ncbi:ABC transporter permease [Lactiplantibacillus mudanjiangensis]|uniref:Glycine betaine/carnitine/choline ABC transporter, permease protein [Lactobacillus plantarum JDM1] n=1 Tax=Lactiplantibacillus mudanjiangensis TaxID=1296538 RepID=A0A660E244_9LACO|nr:ABC transporter permease [Lactiplantibacillus mudanjiangensis]VDG19811.1 glycine betaine/carnitine/choline ABC transporter, permease protein [Lactobacillus plantarum JDM1] [Lactiplantibacillus mudanjiangensis]VDG24508.1 glycine betaine/carnitine/choline ABC transporter, permease protein [Lactobacillus plantarum JDM1] [Lactiplantibacillus mudanjiangensis]VDG29799.1 glycine betaine/carnitine/choline ABC transporter, permease protein [Lactobacillus plantarum JDM1] [Lactiplantibacillus mudanjiang